MPSERPADLYISGDAEADGPIPGRYSMLSFGLCVAGRFDGTDFERCDPRSKTFYAELQPISDQWDAQALNVARLDRDQLVRTGRSPREAMMDASSWVQSVAGDDRPVFVGFPAAFDWLFLYWYFVTFADEGSPFDFSAVLDMKTMFQQKAFEPWPESWLAEADLADGELPAGRERFEHAWALASELGGPCWEGAAGQGLGRIACQDGQVPTGLRLLEEARRRAGSPPTPTCG